MTTQQDPAVQAAILALLPGSTEPGVWEINQTANSASACTYLDERRAVLPEGSLPEDRLITLHEIGHVRWDLPSAKLDQCFPAWRLPYVQEYYLMCREWVIDARLTETAEDIRPSTNILDWTTVPDPASWSRDLIARRWMQWYYRSQHPAVVQACKDHLAELWSCLEPADRDILARAYAEIMADLWDDTRSETWAVKLAAHFAPPPPPPATDAKPPESAAATQQRANAIKQRARAAQATAADARAQTSATRLNPQQAQREASQEQLGSAADLRDEGGQDVQCLPPAHPQHGARDADLRTIAVHHHLDAQRTGKRVKDPIGMRRHGAVPTHTEYLKMGGSIFKESPRPAGTILLDASSSMSWTEGQLQEAIRLAPNLTVAGYANAPSRVGRMLCVLAHKGRTSRTVPCATGGENRDSDIAALLWLARQPEPRIIVSDGEWWGSQAPNYSAVCNAICRRYKIVRVATMDRAILWLRRKLTPVAHGDVSAPTANARRKG